MNSHTCVKIKLPVPKGWPVRFGRRDGQTPELFYTNVYSEVSVISYRGK